MLNDTVYYRIYRGTEKDFTPSEENMVCKKVFKGYWIDLESAKDEKWYYKVEAVRADSSGEIEEQELIDTVLSGTEPHRKSLRNIPEARTIWDTRVSRHQPETER